ncbi:Elongation factor Tu-A [Pseudomonas sp. MM221]|nr:Elongation factor Tu-A [Pseudomonas sp. MM223]CAI3809711.1 Elongation factor Tu-A [Pseudomonas sp. MM221]
MITNKKVEDNKYHAQAKIIAPHNHKDGKVATNELFLMRVDKEEMTEGGRSYFFGTIEGGSVKNDDPIIIIGSSGATNNLIKEVTKLVKRKGIDNTPGEGRPGDYCRLLTAYPTRMGNPELVYAPGALQPQDRVRAEVYVLRKEEGGTGEPISDGERYRIETPFGLSLGNFEIPEGGVIMPGDKKEVTIALFYTLLVRQGMEFKINNPDQNIGKGVIGDIW